MFTEPEANQPQGHPDFELTLEQLLRVRNFNDAVHFLTEEKAKELLKEMHKFMLLQQNAYQHFVKEGFKSSFPAMPRF